MNKTQKLLTETHRILSQPDAWTQGTQARDSHGLSVSVTDDDAVSFCLYGGVNRAYANLGIGTYRLVDRAVKTLAFSIGRDLVCFNDEPGRTKQEVLNAIKKAI